MKLFDKGEMPLAGRIPASSHWRLLRLLADDVRSVIDLNDYKLIVEICSKKDFDQYKLLSEYWGLQSIDPSHHASSICRNAALYQLASFFKKYDDDTVGNACKKAKTIQLFYDYERHCREYNRGGYRRLTWSDDTKIQLWYARMMLFINNVLGPLELTELLSLGRHGPGRSYGLSANRAHRFYKNTSFPYDVTADAVDLARAAVAYDQRWVFYLENAFSKPFSEISTAELFRVVPGNLVLMVPKDREVYRTIAAEPTMNVYLQLAVDAWIRERLKKYGVNLDDQKFNQLLAEFGSLDNMIATLDLKGASATVTCRLVEKLLPYDWVMLLMRLRCDVGEINDTVIHYEQMSSMGNGYTFALESLIFAAAVFAVGGTLGVDSAVYGDDLAVPTGLVSDLIKLLTACGFLINMEKSFYQETYTRESCGTDWEKGYNIRPVFLRKPLESMNAFSIYSLHNLYMKWYHTYVGPGVPAVCQQIRKWLPVKAHIFGPPNREDMSTYLTDPNPSPYRHPFGMGFNRITPSQDDQIPRKALRFVADAVVIDCYQQGLWLNHDLAGKPNTRLDFMTIVENDEFTGNPRDLQQWVDLLNYQGVGTRFKVTIRGDYAIGFNTAKSYCYDWPLTY